MSKFQDFVQFCKAGGWIRLLCALSMLVSPLLVNWAAVLEKFETYTDLIAWWTPALFICFVLTYLILHKQTKAFQYRTAIVTATLGFIFLILSITLYSTLTVKIPGAKSRTPIGLSYTEKAQANVEMDGYLTRRELLKRSGYEPKEVWTERSISNAETLIVVPAAISSVLIVTMIVALTLYFKKGRSY